MNACHSHSIRETLPLTAAYEAGDLTPDQYAAARAKLIGTPGIAPLLGIGKAVWEISRDALMEVLKGKK